MTLVNPLATGTEENGGSTTLPQLEQRVCKIQARNGEGVVISLFGTNTVVVGDKDDKYSLWSVPALGSQGQIVNIETGRTTFISESNAVLAEGNHIPQIWQVSPAGGGHVTIQAVGDDLYWTDNGPITAKKDSGTDDQKFTLYCPKFN